MNSRKSALIKGFFLFLVLIAVSLAWRYTPLSEWINFNTVLAWQESVKNRPAALGFVVAAYLLGSLVLFPVTILNVATIFAFGPILGNAYSLAGWLVSAAAGYGVGHAFGRDFFQKMAGHRLNRFLQAERHGFLTVLTIRLLPVAPFTVVNLFLGGSSIRFRDFLLGSTVGRIPGMIVLAFAGIQIENVMSKPSVGGVVFLVLTLLLLSLVVSWLSKRLVSSNTLQRISSKL